MCKTLAKDYRSKLDSIEIAINYREQSLNEMREETGKFQRRLIYDKYV